MRFSNEAEAERKLKPNFSLQKKVLHVLIYTFTINSHDSRAALTIYRWHIFFIIVISITSTIITTIYQLQSNSSFISSSVPTTTTSVINSTAEQQLFLRYVTIRLAAMIDHVRLHPEYVPGPLEGHVCLFAGEARPLHVRVLLAAGARTAEGAGAGEAAGGVATAAAVAGA